MKRKIRIQNELKSCGELSLDIERKDPNSGDDPLLERLKEKQTDDSAKHPTPEQLLVREAVKFLTPRQKKVWELYNFDRLTQDQIAKKLNMGQANVAHSIKAIEKRIAKWVRSNMGAYNLLKQETKGDSEE